MHINKEGLLIIKFFEGFRSIPYEDKGKLSVGYGHHLRPGESFPDPITEDEADALLADDCRWAEAWVEKQVTVPLNPDQFSALVSFVYNVGEVDFTPENCTLLRLLNEANYEGAADEFPKWDHSDGKVEDGLLKRRDLERLLFLGQYVDPAAFNPETM